MKRAQWCALLSAALLTPAIVLAQSAGGVAGISGTVHDQSGGVVPNAKVVISSAAQGQLRSITTNESGVFAAPALIPEEELAAIGEGEVAAIAAEGAIFRLVPIHYDFRPDRQGVLGEAAAE